MEARLPSVVDMRRIQLEDDVDAVVVSRIVKENMQLLILGGREQRQECADLDYRYAGTPCTIERI